MVLPAQRDLVDGEWLDPPRDGVALVHPDTGEEFARSATSSEAIVDRAIEAAARVHATGAWADRSVEARTGFLLDLAERLEGLQDTLAFADSIDSGVPIGVTALFAAALPDVVRGAAAQAQSLLQERVLPSPGGSAHLLRVPWGPAALLTPFNAPAFSAVKKTAYAIAAGCPVVLKPSPHAPHAANLLATAVKESAAAHDAPRALLQLVHGEAGAGAQLAAAAAQNLKALQLECGSNNPAIVRADADVEATAHALVAGFTKLNGQWCERPGTVVVAASLHDALLDSLLDHLMHLAPGPCLDAGTTFGPQGNRHQAQSVAGAVRRLEGHGAAAHVVFPEHASMGCFSCPTIITGADPGDTIDEIFGPVLVVHPVADDSRALELAGTLNAGLAAYVFTTDIDAGVSLGRRVTAGEVKVNGASVLDLSPDSAQSFWAGSGIGGHGNADLLRFFTGSRIVGPDLPDSVL
jgi:betaine-aldehyde dehydrogenase